jgi:phage anti-repressor protein
MNTQLIPVFAGELSGAAVQLVDARLLHTFLEVVTKFNDWIKNRIEEYGFVKDQDFLVAEILATKTGRGGNRKAVIDYHLTLDMAKELGMIERNDKGRQIRRYFLEMERIAQPQYGLKQIPAPRAKRHVKGGLELIQQDAINDFIKERLLKVPQARRAAMSLKIYSAINSKFGVTGTKDGYKNIAPEHFANIMQLISRIPLEGDNLLVFTEEDFNALVAEKFKAIDGEVMPKAEAAKNRVTLCFEGEPGIGRRLLVDVERNTTTIHLIENDALVMNEERFIKHLVDERGFLVVRKDDVLKKLIA